jgi:hypothetical protein
MPEAAPVDTPPAMTPAQKLAAYRVKSLREQAGALKEPEAGRIPRGKLRKIAAGYGPRGDIPMSEADVSRKAAMQEANRAYDAKNPKADAFREEHQGVLEEMANAAGPRGPELRQIGRAQADIVNAQKGVADRVVQSDKQIGMGVLSGIGRYGIPAVAGGQVAGLPGAVAGVGIGYLLKGRGQSITARAMESGAHMANYLDTPFGKAAASGVLQSRGAARQAAEHYARSMTDPVYRDVYVQED